MEDKEIKNKIIEELGDLPPTRNIVVFQKELARTLGIEESRIYDNIKRLSDTNAVEIERQTIRLKEQGHELREPFLKRFVKENWVALLSNLISFGALIVAIIALLKAI